MSSLLTQVSYRVRTTVRWAIVLLSLLMIQAVGRCTLAASLQIRFSMIPSTRPKESISQTTPCPMPILLGPAMQSFMAAIAMISTRLNLHRTGLVGGERQDIHRRTRHRTCPITGSSRFGCVRPAFPLLANLLCATTLPPWHRVHTALRSTRVSTHLPPTLWHQGMKSVQKARGFHRPKPVLSRTVDHLINSSPLISLRCKYLC